MKKLLAAIALVLIFNNAYAGWRLSWGVSGTVVGKCAIALRTRGGPIIRSYEAPPSAGCYTAWYFSFDGMVSAGEDCSRELQNSWFEIVARPVGLGIWVPLDLFNLAMLAPSCCAAPPPQRCFGKYFPAPYFPPGSCDTFQLQ